MRGEWGDIRHAIKSLIILRREHRHSGTCKVVHMMIRKIIFKSRYELRKTLVFQYGTYTVMMLSCFQYIYRILTSGPYSELGNEEDERCTGILQIAQLLREF